ncbi:MAG TPA: DUF3347 domain-containing protein [Candidatus Angelobacter sp.]|nr:DUF3347 domain-containing protein [Candidatus Angelobacter sp.]
MKPFRNTARFLITAILLTAPLVGLAEDKMDKMNSSALMEPVKSVFDHYLKIEAALAKDSIAGLTEQASAIAKAVRSDEIKMLSPDVAKQAGVLAQAKDLPSAREAFKPLSDSLIKYLADNKAGKGTYHEAYCPMAKASWLQTGTTIKNPYLGKSMPDCGELKN